MNRCEDLINLVNLGEPKTLRGFSQNGAVGGLSSSSWDNAAAIPTGGKGPSNPSVGTHRELGKPVWSPRVGETTPQGLAAAMRVADVGGSEGGAVMASIRVEPPGNITRPKRGLTSDRSDLTRDLISPFTEECA